MQYYLYQLLPAILLAAVFALGACGERSHLVGSTDPSLKSASTQGESSQQDENTESDASDGEEQENADDAEDDSEDEADKPDMQ